MDWYINSYTDSRVAKCSPDSCQTEAAILAHAIQTWLAAELHEVQSDFLNYHAMIGFCWRTSMGRTCVGCGDRENGIPLRDIRVQAGQQRQTYTYDKRENE